MEAAYSALDKHREPCYIKYKKIRISLRGNVPRNAQFTNTR